MYGQKMSGQMMRAPRPLVNSPLPDRPSGSAARRRAARDTGTPRAEVPRYESILRTLRTAIQRGRYPVGAMLPPELELCTMFAASRHTVREAIRRLAEQGLVSRRAGSGTTVLRRTPADGFTQQISALPDLLAYVKNARLEILEERDVRANAAEAKLLHCRQGQVWHRLAALKHLKGADRPVAYVIAYVHCDHPALRSVLDRRGVPLHDFIEDKIGQRIVAVEQEFAAQPLLGREAAALGREPGYAGFVIARRYLPEHGSAVLVTSTIFPHDRMRYSMSLKLA
jgi:DNA-binding GntR family transcriptional regulator